MGAPPHYVQLLEVGWWPSTPLDPQTAATMSLLRLFHVTNLQGQVTPTDFYRTLEQMSSGDGLNKLPVSNHSPPFHEGLTQYYLRILLRTVFPNGCSWFGNGGTSKWRSVLAVHTIHLPVGSMVHNLEDSQSHVVPVLILTSTYLRTGQRNLPKPSKDFLILNMS